MSCNSCGVTLVWSSHASGVHWWQGNLDVCKAAQGSEVKVHRRFSCNWCRPAGGGASSAGRTAAPPVGQHKSCVWLCGGQHVCGWRGQRSLPERSGVSCLRRGHSSRRKAARGNVEEDVRAGNIPGVLNEWVNIVLKVIMKSKLAILLLFCGIL